MNILIGVACGFVCGVGMTAYVFLRLHFAEERNRVAYLRGLEKREAALRERQS